MLRFCLFLEYFLIDKSLALPARIAQSVACLTEESGAPCSISRDSPAHTFVEIGHEIISKVFFLLPLHQEGLLSVTCESMCTQYWSTAKEV